tara:strand:+ start:366 stop:1187 length:822 start_codon:yes stop_codon:yes gene_type:complete
MTPIQHQMNTLTTMLSSSSAHYENQLMTLNNMQQQKINALRLKSEITETLMSPGRNGMCEYINARQTYLNNKLDTDFPTAPGATFKGHYLEWKSPLTHSDKLCAFDGGTSSLIREDGSFANQSRWISSQDYSKLSDWTLELWSTATLSGNDPDLPGHQLVLLTDIRKFQDDFESFNIGVKQLDDTKISEVGLSYKYTLQDFLDYKIDWDVGMEWINADTRLEVDAGLNTVIPAGINAQINSIDQSTTAMKSMTAFYYKRMDVSNRRITSDQYL